jgi:hypothetical protein
MKSGVKLIDCSGNIVATACVIDEGDHYGGTIDLRHSPAMLRTLFDEFEEIVSGQMLSFLDEIQAKISSLGIKVVLDDGMEAFVKDLQVYPSTGDVSFMLAEAPTLERNLS